MKNLEFSGQVPCSLLGPGVRELNLLLRAQHVPLSTSPEP